MQLALTFQLTVALWSKRLQPRNPSVLIPLLRQIIIKITVTTFSYLTASEQHVEVTDNFTFKYERCSLKKDTVNLVVC